MMVPATDRQILAMQAICDHVQLWKDAKASEGVRTFLPSCEINDIPDEEAAFAPNEKPKIFTHLSISPDEATGQNFVGLGAAEVTFSATLDWLAIIPRQQFKNRNTVYYDGLKDIEAILTPLQGSGLTDPETGQRRAVSLRLDRHVPSKSDLGDHLILASQIVMTLTLHARSILS